MSFCDGVFDCIMMGLTGFVLFVGIIVGMILAMFVAFRIVDKVLK